MQSNESSKVYQVEKKDHSFIFETKEGILYKIGFIPMHTIIDKVYSGFVFEFSIYTNSKSKDRKYDPLVRNTIVKLLSDFWFETNNIIYYTCDSLDNERSHISRYKLFNKWFDELAPANYTKINQEFNDTMFMSIIINHRNMYYDEIMRDLPNIIEDFNSYK